MTSACRMRPGHGFTLVELLVSLSIVILLVLLLVEITNSTSRTWTYTTAKVEEFRSAREGFESITRRLSQACLNTYWDYDNPNAPKNYVRQSELRFLSGPMAGIDAGGGTRPTHAVFFQAPLGFVENPVHTTLNNLLNTWGYYLEFGDDAAFQPAIVKPFVQKRYRFRLMEMMVPTETFDLYQYTSGADSSGQPLNLTYTKRDWISVPLAQTPTPLRVLAENIVALVLLPKLSPRDAATLVPPDPAGVQLAPAYLYDSTATNANPALNPKNQLPPVVQVTIVAVEETSYSRLQASSTTMPDFGLGSAFQQAQLYDASTSPAGQPGDLEALEKTLTNNKLRYRVFSTNVAIRAAKWSRAQVN